MTCGVWCSCRLAYLGGVSGVARGGGPGVTNTSGPGEGGGGGCKHGV